MYRANEMTYTEEYDGSEDEGSIQHSENKSNSESSEGESENNENRNDRNGRSDNTSGDEMVSHSGGTLDDIT